MSSRLFIAAGATERRWVGSPQLCWRPPMRAAALCAVVALAATVASAAEAGSALVGPCRPLSCPYP